MVLFFIGRCGNVFGNNETSTVTSSISRSNDSVLVFQMCSCEYICGRHGDMSVDSEMHVATSSISRSVSLVLVFQRCSYALSECACMYNCMHLQYDSEKSFKMMLVWVK
jgi:hypothetical protein